MSRSILLRYGGSDISWETKVMSDRVMLFLLILAIVLLMLIILYQRFLFTRDTQNKIREISKKLDDILTADRAFFQKNAG